MTVLLYVAVCFVPAAVFALAARALTWFTTYERPTRRPSPEEIRQELNRYRRDLRRLSDEHTTVLAADHLPAKVARLRAIELAYDDTLRRACEALEIDGAERSPIDPVQRVQVEADLATHGFVW